MTRFSIITCTLNNADFVKANIESVKYQSFDDFEHVFIDGFSTDGTLDIIKEYQKEFPNRVKIFSFKPEGISKAMNQGIEKANGEYLIHLHADDNFFNNQILSIVNEFLNNHDNPDWIYGKINVCDISGSVGTFPNKNIWHYRGGLIKKYLLKFYNYIPHQAVFIKKSVFNKFGLFDEKLKSCMDFDFWLRVKDKTRWLFFDQTITNFLLRSDAMSSGLINRTQNEKEKENMKKKYCFWWERLVLFSINKVLKIKNKNYR